MAEPGYSPLKHATDREVRNKSINNLRREIRLTPEQQNQLADASRAQSEQQRIAEEGNPQLKAEKAARDRIIAEASDNADKWAKPAEGPVVSANRRERSNRVSFDANSPEAQQLRQTVVDSGSLIDKSGDWSKGLRERAMAEKQAKPAEKAKGFWARLTGRGQ